MKKIGIFGGAFDPPHIGHLLIAEQVREQLNLNEIWLMPTYESPHKQSSLIEAKNRVDMLVMATAQNSYFHINDLEIKREGKSYSIDTIKELKASHPNTVFYFIIGADMVQYLSHWHQIDQLVKLVTFVGVRRKGYELKSAYPFAEIEVPLIDISSSQIRHRVEQNQTIKYLVPESVESYINKKGLYE